MVEQARGVLLRPSQERTILSAATIEVPLQRRRTLVIDAIPLITLPRQRIGVTSTVEETPADEIPQIHPTRFGAKLAELRNARGMSQIVLGGLSGVSESTIDKSERGVRIPSSIVIADICRVLKIPDTHPLMDNLLLTASLDRIDAYRAHKGFIPVDDKTIHQYNELLFSGGTHVRNMINTLRQIRGFTQRQLAEFIDISKSAIERINNGKIIPSAVTIANIGRALGIPDSDPLIDELLLTASLERVNRDLVKKDFVPVDDETLQKYSELLFSEGTDVRNMINALRRIRGLYQRELAELAGLPRAIIEKTEGTTLSDVSIASICQVLGIPEDHPVMLTLLLTANRNRIERHRAREGFTPVDAKTLQTYRERVNLLKPKIAIIISAFRAIRGFTQDQLAVFADVSDSEIDKIERGIRIPGDILLAKIWRALGIPDSNPLVNSLLLVANYDRIKKARDERSTDIFDRSAQVS